MSTIRSSLGLRTALFLDAATCGAMALLLLAAARPVAVLTGLPSALLFAVGVSLVPIAGFMALAADRAQTVPLLARLAVAGNLIWVALSFGLLLSGWVAPNGLGVAFVAGQALAVLLLAGLEQAALRRSGLVARAI